MYVGDLIEALGAVCVAAGVYVLLASLIAVPVGIGGGLLSLGAFLVYVAQAFAETPLRSSNDAG